MACCGPRTPRTSRPWEPPQHAPPPTLRVNNSLLPDAGLVPFVPRVQGQVRWYTCGPTVSEPPTLGHCRSLFAFDILRRILEEYFGHDVNFVMGITDIDDGIIVRTRQIEALVAEGYRWGDALQSLQAKSRTGCALQSYDATLNAARDWLVAQGIPQVPDAASTIPEVGTHPGNEGLNIKPLTAEMETLFCKHLKTLGIKPPTAMARVSEHIPGVLTFVETILANGYAYEANGNIYFDIGKFSNSHTYSKLMPCSAEDCEGVLTENCEGLLFSNEDGVKEKRSPKDFVLWRRSKEGEPKWESPWGPGRPGWHIECSVMASNVFGECMDIHSGGEDHKFPHHDNELAQSEARWETDQWVNYFMHHGHLHVDWEAESPNSRNKTVTIDRILETYTPDQLRMFFLLQRYDEAVVFSKNSMVKAVETVAQFKAFFRRTHGVVEGRRMTNPQAWEEEEKQMSAAYLQRREKIHAALCNNFDTRTAVAHLEGLSQTVLDYLDSREQPRALLLNDVVSYMKKMFRCFGLIDASKACFVHDNTAQAFRNQSVAAVMKALLNFKNVVQTEVATPLPGESVASLADTVNSICNTLVNDTLPGLGIALDEGDEDNEAGDGFRYVGPQQKQPTPCFASILTPPQNGVTPVLPPMPPIPSATL